MTVKAATNAINHTSIKNNNNNFGYKEFCFVAGLIKSVWPDTVTAREHDSASFPRTHFQYTAARGIGASEAQYSLPPVCLPVLPVFQVSFLKYKLCMTFSLKTHSEHLLIVFQRVPNGLLITILLFSSKFYKSMLFSRT